jgi:hypothetical protein
MFKDMSTTPLEEKIEKILHFETSKGIKKYFKTHFPVRDPQKKTAYVIGTGPSLKGIDMSKLKNEDTITFNRAYVAFDDWGFHPTYYLSIDSQDLLSISEDIVGLMNEGKIKHFFLPHGLIPDGADLDRTTVLKNVPEAWSMMLPFSQYTYAEESNLMVTALMANAGYMGMKMLYLMGYQEVVLLGCDASYRTDEESQKSIDWDEDGCFSNEDYDVNHFRHDYFGKGQRFGRPISDEETRNIWMTAAFEIQHVMNDFKVYSCSKGSKINDIYPYIDFEDFVSGKRPGDTTSQVVAESFEENKA